MKLDEFEALKSRSLGHLLIKAARIYHEYAFEKTKGKMGVENLKPFHLQIFAHIPFSGITTVELAKKLKISKQAVSKYTKDLIQEGVLIKKENPTDSRSFLIFFDTSKDSSLFRGMRELAKLDDKIIQLLGPKKADNLHETLTKIISNFEQD